MLIPAADAIEKGLPLLSRARIRARFEQRFTSRRMANDYVAVYRETLDKARGMIDALAVPHDPSHR